MKEFEEQNPKAKIRKLGDISEWTGEEGRSLSTYFVVIGNRVTDAYIVLIVGLFLRGYQSPIMMTLDPYVAALVKCTIAYCAGLNWEEKSV